MSWEAELEELRRRQQLARELGGAERVKRHKDGGKLTVRERIDALLDAGSFREIGSISGKADYDADGNITGFTPAYLVMGQGTLDGRPVVVAGDDFTVRGGSAEGGLRDKQVRAEMMARDLRMPIIRLADGTGGGGSSKPNLQAEFSKEPHLRGVCSMARTSAPNSANSQFFICFDDATFLDNQYTVWGVVSDGMDHVDALPKGEPPRSPGKIVTARVAADVQG